MIHVTFLLVIIDINVYLLPGFEIIPPFISMLILWTLGDDKRILLPEGKLCNVLTNQNGVIERVEIPNWLCFNKSFFINSVLSQTQNV